ncbi:universal stress protein [Actinomadura rugatobispora]|uniref:Universal stress protein n=1 Tax=Actinomadura rugatobispora TaxID=1994 RepID=A0ABW1A1N2_9ACTN
MNEIVVGADGSEHGLVAVEWAAAEAARRGAPLRVVHAVAAWLFDAQADPRIRLVREWMRDNGEEVVRQALGRARARAPEVEVSGGQVGGQPAEVLIRESRGALMVVVGSHGSGGLTGLLLGSVALQVTSHASCPAVAVRPDRPGTAEPEPAEGTPDAGEVVVGVDGSPGSAAALDFAFEEAAVRGAPARAVMAWSHPASERPGDMQPLVFDPVVVTEEQERALAEFVAPWEAEYPGVPFIRQVVHARPTRVLAEASARARLLVVGSRGRGGFSGLVLGSVGHAMLHHARCPVAVVHASRGTPAE